MSGSDMVRQCRKYGLRWTRPSVFPRLGVAAAAHRAARRGGAVDRRLLPRGDGECNFAQDQDINEPDGMAAILTALELPAAALIAQAQSEPIKARLRAQTEAARASGIFGAPTVFVGSEMFGAMTASTTPSPLRPAWGHSQDRPITRA